MSAPMRAGTLRREISVQQRATQKDSFGQQLISWVEIKKVYAAIEPMTGSERVAAMSLSTDISHRVTVRFDAIFDDPRIAATYRLVYGTRVFNVQAPLNVDEENRTIELLCSEGMNYG